MKSRIVALSTMFVMVSFLFFAFQAPQQQKAKPWPVPDKYKTLKNPVKSDQAGLDKAKTMWNKYCKSCHGVKGLGDGPKNAGLKTFSGNFSSKEFQAQSDAAIYFKTTEGRDEMPNYKKSIPDDNDRWLLVHYMRTMKK